MQAETGWRPAATLDSLRLRAEMLGRIRQYFFQTGVLEVDTPSLSPAGVTDPAIESFYSTYHGPGSLDGARVYLHTSPEFPMKRLLAAGSGAIYQICKVFRNGESGCNHNPEFTLLEWYRTGFDDLELMRDVESMLRHSLAGVIPVDPVVHWTYRDLFIKVADVDPGTASVAELHEALRLHGIQAPSGMSADHRDDWLDLIMSHIIEPALGQGLVFIRDYPASQAALARLRPGDPPVAARFEVFLNGLELANGYHELLDAAEQRERFLRDNLRRVALDMDPVVMDERLLAAMESGLPECAGVALGIDRLLKIAVGSTCLDAVMAFPLGSA